MANRSSNRAAIPEAKSALDRFKYEVASEIGVPLKDGYNGDLTFFFRTGRKHRRRDGQENDHEAGRADVRQINRLLLPIAPKTGAVAFSRQSRFLLFYFSCIQTRIWFKPRLPHAK